VSLVSLHLQAALTLKMARSGEMMPRAGTAFKSSVGSNGRVGRLCVLLSGVTMA